MTPNYIPKDPEMNRIVDAFSGYIHRHPNLDLVWSEKLGYILLSIDTVQDCLYSTSIYTDAQKLARRLFEEVVTDVVLECEDCDDVSSMDDEGREEVKRRWVPFLEMLPEYKSICEDILAGNKDKYSE